MWIHGSWDLVKIPAALLWQRVSSAGPVVGKKSDTNLDILQSLIPNIISSIKIKQDWAE